MLHDDHLEQPALIDANVTDLRVELERGEVIVASATGTSFRQYLVNDRHLWFADEPIELGGTDVGPTPHELLLMSLGACTSMTMKMYARRKSWPLSDVRVRLRFLRGGEAATVERKISMMGVLDCEQRARLVEIAEKCPIHRLLSSGIVVVTSADEEMPSGPRQPAAAPIEACQAA